MLVDLLLLMWKDTQNSKDLVTLFHSLQRELQNACVNI